MNNAQSATAKQHEEFLFTITKKVLKWAGYNNPTDEEIADLVMLELLDTEHESICTLCNKKYDRTLDSIEIKESGEYICQECWNTPE